MIDTQTQPDSFSGFRSTSARHAFKGDPDFALSQGRSEKYDTSRRKAEQADVERLTNSHVARAFGPVAARTNNPHVVVKDAVSSHVSRK